MSKRYKYWASSGHGDGKAKVWHHTKGIICECADYKDALMIKDALYLLHDKKRGKVVIRSEK